MLIRPGLRRFVGSQIPANAIKLRDGSYLVDRTGKYVVTR